MTREELELRTDIRDFTILFYVILRRETSGRFIKTKNIKCDLRIIIKNIFITDAQTGSVKLITSIKGIVKYLGHLGLLYKAFSVHMKHQTVPKRSLPQAIELLEELDSYLGTTTEKHCRIATMTAQVNQAVLEEQFLIRQSFRSI